MTSAFEQPSEQADEPQLKQPPADAVRQNVPSEPGASSTESGSTESGSTESRPAAKGPATKERVAKGAPNLRMKIGSQRADDSAKQAKPKPIDPAAPTVGKETKPVLFAREATGEKTSYPPPNLREQLSEDLQSEFNALIGEEPLDTLMEGAAALGGEETLESESQVQARVTSVHREDVFLDLGGRNQGIVPLKQFEEPPEPGCKLEVIVNRFNKDDGLYEVALPGAAVDVGDWSSVHEGLVVEVVVTGHNTGGLECAVGGLRGFMPISQVSLYRVENLEEFVGQKFTCLVTESDPDRRNLVLSRRAVLEREKAEKREKLLATLQPGQMFDGTITSLKDFGAFVDIGGADGLLHISKLSWERIEHPSEVLEVGQKVHVTIEKFDAATGRISLDYRDRTENPWNHASDKYPATTIVQGKVTKIMEFGAFVRIEAGIEGLVHISELSHRRVHRVSDVVQDGQEVEVQVLSIDPDAHRISLSMKALETRPQSATEGASEEVDESLAATTPKVDPQELRGGLSHGAGGDQIGLNW